MKVNNSAERIKKKFFGIQLKNIERQQGYYETRIKFTGSSE